MTGLSSLSESGPSLSEALKFCILKLPCVLSLHGGWAILVHATCKSFDLRPMICIQGGSCQKRRWHTERGVHSFAAVRPEYSFLAFCVSVESVHRNGSTVPEAAAKPEPARDHSLFQRRYLHAVCGAEPVSGFTEAA